MNKTALQSVFLFRVETNFDGGTYNAIFKSFNVEIVKKLVIEIVLVTASAEMASDQCGLHAI